MKSQQQNLLKNPEYSILFTICIAHLFNDLLQAIIPAIYPKLEAKFGLSFTQVGMITLCYQLAASIFQPIVGAYTDKNPKPYSQIFGMCFTISGITLLAFAPSYSMILIAVILVGIGSSIFHPESSRVAYLASNGRRSFAQSIFQIGGNTGTALAPLLIAAIVLSKTDSTAFFQTKILWFVLIGISALIALSYIAKWYSNKINSQTNTTQKEIAIPQLSQIRIISAIVILLVLIFSKYFYISSITSYFQFYIIKKFGISEIQAQVYLFYFLTSVAIGTLLGGIFGDKFGRKHVIWFSVFGAAPFTLILPLVSIEWTAILIVIIGLIMSSAFPAILVYAQELLPKKIGMVSGLFYGFAFGMGGLGSAVLGYWADLTSIEYVYSICAYLPLIGVIAFFLPNLKKITFKKTMI